ncbi:ADP-ribosylglycohydrolase family protein [Ferrimonas balearica]|uniref:ADP-ribosylglycohydrolase family protein n=1 Tax=Ferrimonas balearica TaxID=44012 RepID=UPI001F18BE32|nr:ADP-ribosylglycohydrolase family protein [Ferrimonas balearica]MBY6093949.1 ADP-ribosylglycohydrolase family protein [Ferrimonas balearica]
MTLKQLHDRAQGALLGLALGDALGTTLEFLAKDSYTPITDLVGGGLFDLKAGQWTDDTAMALCLAHSLIETGRNDIVDQMERYLRWYREGENACTGECFNIDRTVRRAVELFDQDGNPVAGIDAEWAAGNGSLVRTAPLALFFHDGGLASAITGTFISCVTTHGEQRAVEACELLAYYLHRILNTSATPDKESLLINMDPQLDKVRANWHPEIQAIANGDYRSKSRDEIHGSNYVVHCLEAALWCFLHSNSFEEGALLAANLGDDADTTAAVYGQLAGAYYGIQGLPESWLEKLYWRECISKLAVLLTCANRQSSHQSSDSVTELADAS